MKTVLVLLLLGVVFVFGQSNPIRTFRANFKGEEFDLATNVSIRKYDGLFFYQDTWPSSGRQAMRLDILLNSGGTTRTLTQMYIYEDQFFKFTICGGKCAWQDLFAEEPLPKLYIENGDVGGTATVINGVTVTPYVFSTRNAINQLYTNWIRLWVLSAVPNYAVRADLTYAAQGIMQRLDFSAQDVNLPPAIFNYDGLGCPNIQPGCFRVDISMVLDISGSVTNAGVQAGLNFIIALTDNFLVGPKYIQVGLVSFSYCYNIDRVFPMQSNKATLTTLLNQAKSSLSSEGWTCIVGGIQFGFWNFNATNNGRPATRKSLIVITDGNGNRPCSTRLIDVSPGEECGYGSQGSWNTGILTTQAPQCGPPFGTNSPCNGEACCQQVHDYQLRAFYGTYYAAINPTIYAVGVGSASDISDATLRLIVNDPIAIQRGDARIFRVDSWASLSTIVQALAAAILCDVEGSETCPQDCRPGGFCCAGGCLCSIDCSTLANECQRGTCRADSTGARCVLGAPDNSSCQDPHVQCLDRYCLEGQGCIGTPNDTKPCTDNNACTNDVCSNGTCVSTKNASVSNCNDFNGCTSNDTCQADGSCVGTKNDTASCTDGNLCTEDRCFNATCQSVPNVTCTDTDTSDCLTPKCNPQSGLCEPTPIEPGFECAPPPPGDACTVFICDRFNPDDYRTCIANGQGSSCNVGRCREAIRDLDECQDSSINTAGIIGGVIAGVAFIAIVGLAILILVLFLLRKKVVDVLGNLNPFGKDVVIQDNPAHVDPTTTHVVPAELGS